MKRYLLLGVALTIFGLAATPLISQTQTTTSSSSSGYVQASKIVGTKVKTQNGEEVGVVKDVVLDRSNGCMAYTVLSTGGSGTRVTGQSKMVAVPWSVYSVSPDSTYLTTTVERDRLYNGPVFEYSRIGDPSFTSTVYSTFGVSGPGVGVSNATSTTTGINAQTQTNAQTQANTNANTANTATNANNPPPPAAGPTNNPSPGMSASPNAMASATAAPSVNASTKSTHGAKGGTSPASSPRHRGDEATKGTGATDESASESTGGSSSGTKASKSSKKGSSAEKSTSEESSGETTEGSSSTKKSSHKKSGSSEGTTAEPTPQE